MLKRVACMLLAAVLVLAVPLCSLADSFDPHRAMAFMVIKFDCGCSRYGTGSMIGRYGLVTAGHNLYCPTHGKGLKSCDFIFGAKSPNSGRYKYNGTFSYYVYDTFRNGYSSKDDIGYVIFDKPVGDSTGWFGYWAASDDDMNMEFTNVYLYSNKGKLQTLYTIQYVADSKQIYAVRPEISDTMNEILSYILKIRQDILKSPQKVKKISG